ncbi:MAG: DUF4832 domain-containing protein [Clostridiales bacterium]|nr:DUF4832 domain-containing protein [Clostridiales bacterium]
MGYKHKKTKVQWTPLSRTEKAEVLQNPYCGLYSIYRFFADSDREAVEGTLIEDVRVEETHRICLVEINLLKFNETELPKEALEIVRRIFSHFASLRKQMIVRFLYDWEGKGIVSEPKDISVILNHMCQLAPLLKGYAKDIYILQGLFIGSWGEMHNSRYLSEKHITRLARQLYECSGESTQIALRCPNFWRMIFKTYQPLDRACAFKHIQKARFSLFNDGIMASDTDFGTYGNVEMKDARYYSEKWIRKDELEFQNQLCKYVSNGGEVINECSWNDVSPALEGLRKMRISYLHSRYDEKVLNKWKAAKSGINNALWKDRTAFEYIEAHLGYRFAIMDAGVSLAPDKSGRLRVAVRLINQGFAPCYHKFEVKLVIRDTSFLELYEYEVDTDTRMWMPGEPVELEALIAPAQFKLKNYMLCLGIYDPQTEEKIQIANTFSVADYMGNYSLGSFTVYIP